MVHNFWMDNPNLLNCLILTRNTLPLSPSLPFFIYTNTNQIYNMHKVRPKCEPSSLFLLSPSSSYVSLLLHPSLFLFPSLSSSLLLTSSFLLYLLLPLSSSLPLPFSSLSYFLLSILPLFFSSCYKHSLNPMLHDTSFANITTEVIMKIYFIES